VAGIRGLATETARGGQACREGLDMIACSIEGARGQLERAIGAYRPPLDAALGASPGELAAALGACLDLAGRRLGFGTAALELDVLLVPFSPFALPCEVISAADRHVVCYTDYRVFRRCDFAQATLAVIAVTLGAAAAAPLWDQIASAVTREEPQRRAMARILMIVLANMTAAHAVRAHLDPSHVDNAERLGIYQRYRRLTGAAAPAWRRYLSGSCPPDQAVRAVARALREMPADYYIMGEPVDAMVADFYLLELMSAEGNPIAGALLEKLEAALAEDFTRYLHIAVGAELGHFQATPLDTLPDELRGFVAAVNAGDSRLRWPELYAAAGVRALLLAEEAFCHSGPEFGGRAWAPIAALLRDYLTGRINRRVFIDQCFSIKHNNGPIFDKIYDVSGVGSALAAQAAGDLARLAALASPEVRHLYRRGLALRRLVHDPVWLGVQQDTASDVADWEDRYGWQNPRDRPKFHEYGARALTGE
jgi:hypothetical protein